MSAVWCFIGGMFVGWFLTILVVSLLNIHRKDD